MIVYHRTREAAATEILSGGFRDATGRYMTEIEHTGVWFSDRPLDLNDGATSALLMIDIPEAELVPYEWIEDGKDHREFLIPASLANRFGPPTLTMES